MPRTWGRSSQVKLGASHLRSMLDVERLEHRLALSVAPITPADSALVWSVNSSAESPGRIISLPAAYEAMRATQSPVEILATPVINSPLPVIERVAETIAGYAESGVVNVAFERVGKVVENVAVISQSLPAPSAGIEHVGEFWIDRAGEPISIIINRVPPEKIDAIEHIHILPAPHGGEFLPIEGVTILPAYDFKPGENRGSEPGFWVRMPSFVAAPDTSVPKDGTVVATSARTVSGETHIVPAGAQAVAAMQTNPFTLALAGAPAGQVGKVPWLLPQVEVSADVHGGEPTGANDSAAASTAKDAATIVAPAVAAGAARLVANVETAFSAIGDIAPQADLLASIDLGTAALDEALASVMNEVEDLGSDLFGWFDDAGLNSWARSAAALAVVGVGGAIALRWRAKRMLDEQGDSESTTWLFHQLQSSTHA